MTVLQKEQNRRGRRRRRRTEASPEAAAAAAAEQEGEGGQKAAGRSEVLTFTECRSTSSTRPSGSRDSPRGFFSPFDGE